MSNASNAEIAAGAVKAEIRTFGNGGVSYGNPSAVDIFRAQTLKSSLNLFVKTGLLPTRGVSSTRLLQLASEYTGKKYKRGQNAIAAKDLEEVVAAKLAAATITHE